MQLVLFARHLCWVLMSLFVVSAYSQTVDVASHKTQYSLQDSVSLALQHHPKLQLALSQIVEQSAQLSQIEAGLLPTVSLSLGIGREDSNNSTTRAINGAGSEEMERREAGVAVTQLLFDGFRQDNLRKAQKQRHSAEQWFYLNQASELALSAIEAHLEVAFSHLDLEAAIANLKVHEQIAKDVGLRVRSGKDDRARVSQISARLSLALANVESAKNRVLLAKSSYQREVGVTPASISQVQSTSPSLPDSETALIEQVLAGNDYFQGQQKRLQAGKLDETASMGTRLPSLFLETGATWNDNIDGVSGRNSDAYIMLRMRYDLYKGGADRAQERVAKSRHQSLRYELDDLRRELENEASMAWLNYHSYLKRLVFLKDYIASAETTKAAYAQQFHIGQRSLIDLLDAENELLNAKNQLSGAQKESMLASYLLMHLQGNLLAEFDLALRFLGDE